MKMGPFQIKQNNFQEISLMFNPVLFHKTMTRIQNGQNAKRSDKTKDNKKDVSKKKC